MDDINPKASNDEERKKGPKEDHVDYGFDIWKAEKAGITVMEIDTLGEPMFVDRFQPKSFKKCTIINTSELKCSLAFENGCFVINFSVFR